MDAIKETLIKGNDKLLTFLKRFNFSEKENLFEESASTKTEYVVANSLSIPCFVNEFWTSRQRQASSLHEISYRACFKPQLPRFFIEILTCPGECVYDPFSGRGTTAIEAGILDRNVVANDINPISRILCEPRFYVPDLQLLEKRLDTICFEAKRADIDLSMFYNEKTEAEIVSLKDYLDYRKKSGEEDHLDRWIRMIATNRLTGHSAGFFSVYTLPPNQAVSPESQKKINEKRKQKPEYRDVKRIILKKSYSLAGELSEAIIMRLKKTGENALLLTKNAANTPEIESESVKLTVTSPPFLDVVQYDDDNWLRCWFNSIDAKEVAAKITMAKKIEDWCGVMRKVFEELLRITKAGGYVVFEVGEVKGGKLKLEEYVVPLGLNAGFDCEGIMINQQEFTKTANIWGVSNNKKGTNTNRIVMFCKR
jgi:DNA modification methylase